MAGTRSCRAYRSNKECLFDSNSSEKSLKGFKQGGVMILWDLKIKTLAFV